MLLAEEAEASLTVLVMVLRGLPVQRIPVLEVARALIINLRVLAVPAL